MTRRIAALALACGTAPLLAQAAPVPRAPRYVEATPYAAADHAGWRSLFDGRTLRGWEGPAGAWRVEDGAIVASDEGQARTVYLYWGGAADGLLADFEFSAEFKLEGAGANSGVQFRAQMLGRTEKPGSEWESFGYQADLDHANVQTGALIECCAGPKRGPSPRPFRAGIGTFLRAIGAADGRPQTIGTIGSPATLKQGIKVDGWNRLHIVARGNVLLYFLNGQLMSGLIDDDPARALRRGRLAIQLEGSGPRKVMFRDIWLLTTDKADLR